MSSEYGYVIIRFDSRDPEGNVLIGLLRDGEATGYLFELFGTYHTRKAAEEDLLANGARRANFPSRATLVGTVTNFPRGWMRDDECYAVRPAYELGIRPDHRLGQVVA
jgi:hypothetical protein